jgi:hypothetical protein
LLQATVPERHVIASSPNEIALNIELGAAINKLAWGLLSEVHTINDDFSCLYVIRKAPRSQICFFTPSQFLFEFARVLPYFPVIQTIQLHNIHNAHILRNYWKLLFQIIFHGMFFIKPSWMTFSEGFREFALSICFNDKLRVQRRLDPILGLSRLWESWITTRCYLHRRKCIKAGYSDDRERSYSQ